MKVAKFPTTPSCCFSYIPVTFVSYGSFNSTYAYIALCCLPERVDIKFYRQHPMRSCYSSRAPQTRGQCIIIHSQDNWLIIYSLQCSICGGCQDIWARYILSFKNKTKDEAFTFPTFHFFYFLNHFNSIFVVCFSWCLFIKGNTEDAFLSFFLPPF